jgi:hypothetical protein
VRWIRQLWTFFLSWLRSFRLPAGAPDPYEVLHVEEEPDQLRPRALYAVGENRHFWHVTFVCPCGCGETISLNLLPDDSPRWVLHDPPEGPTLEPSVWRTAGCRSHFFVRGGQIVWCHETETRGPARERRPERAH